MDAHGNARTKGRASWQHHRRIRRAATRSKPAAHVRPQHSRRARHQPRANSDINGTSTRPEIAAVDTYSRSLDALISAGRVIGYTDVDTVATSEGLTFSFEMTGRVYQQGETDINEWSITGEPNLKLSNPAVPTAVTITGEPNLKLSNPAVPTAVTTEVREPYPGRDQRAAGLRQMREAAGAQVPSVPARPVRRRLAQPWTFHAESASNNLELVDKTMGPRPIPSAARVSG